ncbi:MAG: GntR family transcriptional regulator [Thermaerobacter sp.]|nr:GntR family transcriptional regulator [Thermaerobacter sp.]MDA8146759.1 GntR family transcriptional regulator [Thermaerobacter sp.]
MRLTIDLTEEKPLYQQIRDQIVEGIAVGLLAEGTPLPPTRRLAADFGINFHTVNKAYELLRREGLVRLHRKRGAVVHVSAPDAAAWADWEARLRILLAEARARGATAEEIQERCRRILNVLMRPAAGEA